MFAKMRRMIVLILAECHPFLFISLSAKYNSAWHAGIHTLFTHYHLLRFLSRFSSSLVFVGCCMGGEIRTCACSVVRTSSYERAAAPCMSSTRDRVKIIRIIQISSHMTLFEKKQSRRAEPNKTLKIFMYYHVYREDIFCPFCTL